MPGKIELGLQDIRYHNHKMNTIPHLPTEIWNKIYDIKESIEKRDAALKLLHRREYQWVMTDINELNHPSIGIMDMLHIQLDEEQVDREQAELREQNLWLDEYGDSE